MSNIEIIDNEAIDRTAEMAAGNLRQLFDAVKAGGAALHTQMRNFGGTEPQNTCEVWSWDEAHLMVGYDVQSLRLLNRDDEEAIEDYL